MGSLVYQPRREQELRPSPQNAAELLGSVLPATTFAQSEDLDNTSKRRFKLPKSKRKENQFFARMLELSRIGSQEGNSVQGDLFFENMEQSTASIGRKLLSEYPEIAMARKRPSIATAAVRADEHQTSP